MKVGIQERQNSPLQKPQSNDTIVRICFFTSEGNFFSLFPKHFFSE